MPYPTSWRQDSQRWLPGGNVAVAMTATKSLAGQHLFSAASHPAKRGYPVIAVRRTSNQRSGRIGAVAAAWAILDAHEHRMSRIRTGVAWSSPVLVGLGAVSWWQFALSAVISVACTFGVARLATAVYRASILRAGPRVPLRELLPARGGRFPQVLYNAVRNAGAGGGHAWG